MAFKMMAIMLGLYLLSESMAAAALMDHGDKVCRLAKYMLTGAAGLWMVLQPGRVDHWHLLMAGSVALFIWPKLIERFYANIKRDRRLNPERRHTKLL